MVLHLSPCCSAHMQRQPGAARPQRLRRPFVGPRLSHVARHTCNTLRCCQASYCNAHSSGPASREVRSTFLLRSPVARHTCNTLLVLPGHSYCDAHSSGFASLSHVARRTCNTNPVLPGHGYCNAHSSGLASLLEKCAAHFYCALYSRSSACSQNSVNPPGTSCAR